MWCPNCKMEYRKGVRVCADCGAELVEGTEADFCAVDLCEFKDEAVADRFLEYLHYSGLEQAAKAEKENGTVYVVTVLEKQRKKAEKLFRGFLLAMKEEQETEELKQLQRQLLENMDEESEIGVSLLQRGKTGVPAIDALNDVIEAKEAREAAAEEAEETEYDWDQEDQEEDSEETGLDSDVELQEQTENLLLSEEAEEDTSDLLYTSTESYVTKEEEYKDFKLSGITFIVFSILGGIFLTLCQMEVLPIRYERFIFIVIALVFVAFFIMGIVSMVKASKIKLEIPAEEAKTKEIYGYLDAELSQEILDSWKDPEVSDVENDLLIAAHIRGILVKAFPGESVVYLEYLSDQYYGDRYMDHEDSEEVGDEELADAEEAEDEELANAEDTEEDEIEDTEE